MTIYAMLGCATTFIFIVMYYLFDATMFACALYQEAVPDYFELFYTYRLLFNTLMGS